MLAHIIVFFFVALVAFSTTMTVGSIGKVREVVTPRAAAGVVVFGFLELLALAYLQFQL